MVATAMLGGCAGPSAHDHLAAGDVVAAMRTGLDVRATDDEVTDFAERVFGLLDFEVVVEVQDLEMIEREHDADLAALLGEALPLRVSWTVRGADALVVDVSEPFGAFELAGQYHCVGQLRPLTPYELARSVGETEALRVVEGELALDDATAAGDRPGPELDDCHEGRVGKTALCLLIASSRSGQASMPPPHEVRRLVAQFLDDHADRLPKSRALHRRLHGSGSLETPRGVEGSRSVVRSGYAADSPDKAAGTAVVLTVSCVSCPDFPVPGTVTALVFVPLEAWAPGDGPLPIWPPPSPATVEYAGPVPPTR